MKWQFERAIDEKRQLEDLSAVGLEKYENGLRIDFSKFPQWNPFTEVLTDLVPTAPMEVLRPAARCPRISRQRRRSHPELRRISQSQIPYVCENASSCHQLQQGHQKYDKIKRPAGKDLVFAFLHQRGEIEAQVRREWAEGLIRALDEQRVRILHSYLMEMQSTGYWLPDDADAGVANMLAVMRLPDYEQRATAAAKRGVAMKTFPLFLRPRALLMVFAPLICATQLASAIDMKPYVPAQVSGARLCLLCRAHRVAYNAIQRSQRRRNFHSTVQSPGDTSRDGRRALSSNTYGFDRNVLIVTIPETLPAVRNLTGWLQIPGDTHLSCNYRWTAFATESGYSIGVGGISFQIGNGSARDGGTVDFTMYRPPRETPTEAAFPDRSRSLSSIPRMVAMKSFSRILVLSLLAAAPQLCNAWGKCTPIVIDLGKQRHQPRPAGVGVYFDMDANGTRDHLQWVQRGGDEGFLALDRSGNGLVDDGAELFGVGTPMVLEGRNAPNGFVGLAQYDSRQLGGNDDGLITEADAIWPQLRIWLDANADGVSTIDEMRTLKSTGLTALETIPKRRKYVDNAGNFIPYWRGRSNDPARAARSWSTCSSWCCLE
jgi:hypothetical protein